MNLNELMEGGENDGNINESDTAKSARRLAEAGRNRGKKKNMVTEWHNVISRKELGYEKSNPKTSHIAYYAKFKLPCGVFSGNQDCIFFHI